MTRGARLAVALVLLGATADAQTPRFPGDVDLVAVETSVIDREGRPVSDLTAADFEVSVDGRLRRVVSAEFRSFVAAPRAVAATDATGSSVPASTVSAGGASIGRTIAIVVDRGELSVGGLRAALDAAALFVDRLDARDRVGVFPLPSGNRVELTTDRGRIKDAIARIGPSNDVPLVEAAPPRAFLSSRVRSAMDRLHALEGVMDALGQIEGSKIAVLVSGGLLAIAAPLDADCIDPMSPRFGYSTHPAQDVVDQLRRVATAAAASRTSLHTLFVSDRSGAMAASKGIDQSGAVHRNTEFRQAPLDILASATGGAFYEVVAGGEGVTARLAEEIAGEYLLGLELQEGDRDGGPHAIRVKVRRDGATVRARRQFVITSPPPRPALPPPPVSTVAAADVPADPSAPTPAGATRSDHVRRMEDARRLLGEGDRKLGDESFEDAAKAYADAIALEPMYFMAHYGLGRARMGQKDYPAAIAAFEQARRVFDERTAVVRGRRAARDAERAARLAAWQATRSTRGASGTAGGRGATPDPVVDIDPGFSTVTEPIPVLPPGLTLALGSAYFRSGRIADAEREYRAAVAAEPKLGEARINLAVVLLMTGRPADAREQIALAKKSGAKVPAGLEKDVDAAIAKGKAS